jgi:hypothetical protein
MDETILTLAQLKAYLGIAADDETQDAELTALLAVLAPWLYDVTGTWFGSEKDEEETLDYAPVVFVNHFPVLSIQGIYRDYNKDHATADMEEQDMGNVRWNKEGRIVLSGRYDFNQSRSDYSDVTVKYKHGIVEVPATVQMAAKFFAAGLYKSTINDGLELSSEAVGSYRKTYKQSSKETVLLAPYVVGRA